MSIIEETQAKAKLKVKQRMSREVWTMLQANWSWALRIVINVLKTGKHESYIYTKDLTSRQQGSGVQDN